MTIFVVEMRVGHRFSRTVWELLAERASDVLPGERRFPWRREGWGDFGVFLLTEFVPTDVPGGSRGRGSCVEVMGQWDLRAGRGRRFS